MQVHYLSKKGGFPFTNLTHDFWAREFDSNASLPLPFQTLTLQAFTVTNPGMLKHNNFLAIAGSCVLPCHRRAQAVTSAVCSIFFGAHSKPLGLSTLLWGEEIQSLQSRQAAVTGLGTVTMSIGLGKGQELLMTEPTSTGHPRSLRAFCR